VLGLSVIHVFLSPQSQAKDTFFPRLGIFGEVKPHKHTSDIISFCQKGSLIPSCPLFNYLPFIAFRRRTRQVKYSGLAFLVKPSHPPRTHSYGLRGERIFWTKGRFGQFFLLEKLLFFSLPRLVYLDPFCVEVSEGSLGPFFILNDNLGLCLYGAFSWERDIVLGLHRQELIAKRFLMSGCFWPGSSPYGFPSPNLRTIRLCQVQVALSE